jgi:MFS family permease
MVGTLPGRSQGLGLVTEPLLQDLQIDRVTYATVNFWATIAGAIGALGVGRLVDRLGARVVLTLVVALLAVVVALMSQVTGVIALACALAATRAIGQGALSVVSIAMVGHWFKRRINMAMAVYSIVLSTGFMIAFPLVGSLVQSWGWRRAWLSIAIALAAGLAPLGWLLVRRSPESIGAAADGDSADAPDRPRDLDLSLNGYAWTEAVSTGAFWVFAAGASLYGLVASGIGLFNESILAERGFGHDIYYQTLVVTAMTALVGNFLGGWLGSKIPLARLMAIALFILATGVAVLPHLSSLASVITWAVAMGLGGGIVMVLFFSVWPNVFGRRHLGRIQGIAQAMTVLASAVGPLLLAWGVDATGSYAEMFRILSVVIGIVALASLVVSVPAPMKEPAAA